MKFSSSEITQIIVAIIGLIGLIFQGIITYLISKSKDNKAKKASPTIIKISQNFSKNPKKYKWISFIVAFIFLTITFPGLKTSYNKIFVVPYITISYPENNQYIDAEIDLNGKYRNINQNKQLIWIAVYSYIDNKYFLHNRPVDINPNDRSWTNNNTIVGLPSDNNKKFNILLLLVDSNSKSYNEILNYLEDKNRHGLDKLPDGVQILKQNSVYIK